MIKEKNCAAKENSKHQAHFLENSNSKSQKKILSTKIIF